MDFNVIKPDQKITVKNALQKIFDAAEVNENLYIQSQVIKITEALNIEILM